MQPPSAKQQAGTQLVLLLPTPTVAELPLLSTFLSEYLPSYDMGAKVYTTREGLNIIKSDPDLMKKASFINFERKYKLVAANRTEDVAIRAYMAKDFERLLITSRITDSEIIYKMIGEF